MKVRLINSDTIIPFPMIGVDWEAIPGKRLTPQENFGQPLCQTIPGGQERFCPSLIGVKLEVLRKRVHVDIGRSGRFFRDGESH